MSQTTKVIYDRFLANFKTFTYETKIYFYTVSGKKAGLYIFTFCL